MSLSAMFAHILNTSMTLPPPSQPIPTPEHPLHEEILPNVQANPL